MRPKCSKCHRRSVWRVGTDLRRIIFQKGNKRSRRLALLVIPTFVVEAGIMRTAVDPDLSRLRVSGQLQHLFFPGCLVPSVRRYRNLLPCHLEMRWLGRWDDIKRTARASYPLLAQPPAVELHTNFCMDDVAPQDHETVDPVSLSLCSMSALRRCISNRKPAITNPSSD